MDCLIGYIGLSSRIATCPSQQREGEVGANMALSGLYVDTLPDISLELTEKTPEIDEEIIELWQLVEKRGILKFRTLFISEVNRCHHVTDVKLAECLICDNKELLATSLWYLLGAELLLENLGSPRINRYTTLDRDKNKELRAELMDVFTHELSVAVAGIDVHNSSCIESDVVENNLITTHAPIM